MLVRLLQATIYREDGWTWWTEDIPDPTWDDIEASIRRLDRYCHPFVMLFREPYAEEDELPDFNVIGGEGMYALDCMDNHTQYHYYDPTHGDEEIELWLSDQGYATKEKDVCYDINTVLKATRYFCEHALPDPDLTWQTRQLPG